jgi:hypothetical protein
MSSKLDRIIVVMAGRAKNVRDDEIAEMEKVLSRLSDQYQEVK